MSLIKLIKEALPIDEAFIYYTKAYTGKVKMNRRKYNICCPFHSDKIPNFTIYTDTNTFRCWARYNDRKTGDIIDLVRIALGTDIKNGLQIIKRYFDLEILQGNRTFQHI